MRPPSPTSPRDTVALRPKQEPASGPGSATVATTPPSRMRSAPSLQLRESPRLAPTQFPTERALAAVHNVTCSQTVTRRCSLYGPGAYGGSPAVTMALAKGIAGASLEPTPRLLVAQARPADVPPAPMPVAGAGGAGPASPTPSPVSARKPSPLSRADATDSSPTGVVGAVAAPALAVPGRRQISCGASVSLPVGSKCPQPLAKAVLRCAAPPPQAKQEPLGEAAAPPQASARSPAPAPKAVSTRTNLVASGSVRSKTPMAMGGPKLVKQAVGYVPVVKMGVNPVASGNQELPRALSVPAMPRTLDQASRAAQPSHPKSAAAASAASSPAASLGTGVARPTAPSVSRTGVRDSPGRS